jgi:hypothetical protein
MADSMTPSFACLNYAFAKAIATTHLFPTVHHFEFNRSYQIPTYPSSPQNFVSTKHTAKPNLPAILTDHRTVTL